MHDRIVFLVGARRSGTNWLQRTLSVHPDVVGLPSETYLFSHGIAPLLERFQDANPGSPMMGRTYMRRESLLDAVRELVDQAFLQNLEHLGSGARYCLERTPWHASQLELIHSVCPDARVIHIIRDGRAVARSLLSMDWGPKTMTEAAEEWRTAVADGRAGGTLFGSRYREVFYERLLADPGREFTRLLEWLGLDTTEDTRTQILLEARSEFNVDPGSPGVREDKWRLELSPTEIREFERQAGPELDALGYGRAGGASGRGDAAARLGKGVGRGIRWARSASHPRAAARAAAARGYARRSRRAVREKHEIVERFDRMLSEGRITAARSLLAEDVKVRIVQGDESFRGRGGEAAGKLLAAVTEHHELGLLAAAGELHGSPGTFTSVTRYQLADGSRWTRVFVLYVTYPKISSVVMYRLRLMPDEVDSVRQSAPRVAEPAQ
jgi:hypothetical protein